MSSDYTQRAVTVFSSMNIPMDAIPDFAVTPNDSRREPKGKNA